jgi:two-component system cell cycle sensor histidine kinase/response regulator CckA
VLDLNESLRNAGKMLRSLMVKDVEIEIVTTSDRALVQADPDQMDQVLVNLAMNARDAMAGVDRFLLETSVVELDENSPYLHRWMRAGKYMAIAVRDNGIGMDENTQARCSDPFFTTKGSAEGRGLGLTTVFGIVRASGEEISLSSDPGRGTTFTIYLPSVEYKIGAAN